MKIQFHIRKPNHVSGRSRAWQRSGTAPTFCGDAPTDHDIRAGWKAWPEDPIGNYICCEKCIAARKEADRVKRVAAN